MEKKKIKGPVTGDAQIFFWGGGLINCSVYRYYIVGFMKHYTNFYCVSFYYVRYFNYN